jgi:hypothetical protein
LLGHCNLDVKVELLIVASRCAGRARSAAASTGR